MQTLPRARLVPSRPRKPTTDPCGRFAPVNPGRGLICIGRDVFRLAPGGRYQVDVASSRALIAHQATDERDMRAIRRPARHRDLQTVKRSGIFLRIDDAGGLRVSGCRCGVELCHPPVVLPRRWCGDIGQLLRVRRPVKLVNMQLLGSQQFHLAAACVDRRHPLHLESFDPDDA